MSQQTVLTVDLGAESGRVMAVSFDGARLSTAELNRFANPVTAANQTMYWDFLHLWREIQAGIAAGAEYNPASIGVDAWGVDFALLDRNGDLISNPVIYRDLRTEGMMEAVFERVPRAEVFARTGVQFMRINTLYQMMSLVSNESPQLDIAETLLMVPDLLNYWLTGARVSEFTAATTSQMLDPAIGNWAEPMLNMLGMPTHILPEIVPSGTKLGHYEDISVIAPACHDTGSAVAAVPAGGPDFAYISSGTWSLLGLEVERPVINDAALEANVTNEGGVYGTYRLLKNITGLWIVQQCRQHWSDQGETFSYGQLVEMAGRAAPFTSFIDPDDPTFLTAGDHPLRVQSYCARSGQAVPDTRGAILRVVLESLALKYKMVLDTLIDLAERDIAFLHIVGGGSQNDLLNQMTADATGLPVVCGPVEATVLGNTLVQLITLGEIDGLAQGRQVIAESGSLTIYEPQHTAEWRAAYERFQKLMNNNRHDS